MNLYALTFAVFLSVPMIVLLANIYGAAGAATVWIIFNTSFIILIIPVMHRRLLPREKWNWYVNDVLKPVLAVLITAGLFRYAFIQTLSPVPLFVQLAAVFALVSAAAFMSACYIRKQIFNRLIGRI